MKCFLVKKTRKLPRERTGWNDTAESGPFRITGKMCCYDCCEGESVAYSYSDSSWLSAALPVLFNALLMPFHALHVDSTSCFFFQAASPLSPVASLVSFDFPPAFSAALFVLLIVTPCLVVVDLRSIVARKVGSEVCWLSSNNERTDAAVKVRVAGGLGSLKGGVWSPWSPLVTTSHSYIDTHMVDILVLSLAVDSYLERSVL